MRFTALVVVVMETVTLVQVWERLLKFPKSSAKAKML